ncbi:hypothetical protein [Acrocarpospora catenulata]|uniref:hypothetical protein n=1 Tax=Acrocarpospora catenulata TaxID=2836182 RepID=UPI001BDA7C26|nr:hypothetical protein [Acrocarpospora catenulata]
MRAGVIPLAAFGDGGEIPVPYVIARSGELVNDPLLFAMDWSRRREVLYLTYASRRAADWVGGILRARVLDSGVGDPLWRQVNTVRQWRCMSELLCQVCGLPAAEPGEPIPWILTETAFHGLAGVPDADGGAGNGDAGDTNQPPTCRRCIPSALAFCPRLGVSAEVVTAGSAEPVAVLGELFQPGEGAGWRWPVSVGHNVYIGLDEFARHPRVLATQLVMRLHDIRREGGGAGAGEVAGAGSSAGVS